MSLINIELPGTRLLNIARYRLWKKYLILAIAAIIFPTFLIAQQQINEAAPKTPSQKQLLATFQAEDGWKAIGPYITSDAFGTEVQAINSLFYGETDLEFLCQRGKFRIYQLKKIAENSTIDVREELKTLGITDIPNLPEKIDPENNQEESLNLSGVDVKVKMTMKTDGTVRTCIVFVDNTNKTKGAVVSFNIDGVTQKELYFMSPGERLTLNFGSIQQIHPWVTTFEEGKKEDNESYIKKAKIWIRQNVILKNGKLKPLEKTTSSGVRG